MYPPPLPQTVTWRAVLMLVFIVIRNLVTLAVTVWLVVLLIRALRKYLGSGEARKEKSETARSLGEVLRRHREECRMTQEFVAEHLGVSRQAVSKWESGASDPNTANLIAVAKLYGTTAEEILKEVREA